MAAPSRSAVAAANAPTATTQLSAAARTSETTAAEKKKTPVSNETASAAVSRQVRGAAGAARNPGERAQVRARRHAGSPRWLAWPGIVHDPSLGKAAAARSILPSPAGVLVLALPGSG